MRTRANEKIGFGALLYAVYAILIPFNQVLNFSGTGTITRYVGAAVIAVVGMDCLIKFKKNRIYLEQILFFAFIAWSFLTVLWGINGTSIPTTLISQLLMFTVVSLRKLNNKETKLIVVVTILSCIALAFQMVTNVEAYTGGRGTIATEAGEADPNTVSVNLAIATLAALWIMFGSNKKAVKLMCIAASLFMIIAMVVTGSRTGLLALGCGYLYTLIVKGKGNSKKIWFKMIFILILAVIVVFFAVEYGIISIEIFERLTVGDVQETGGNGRLEIWKAYFKALMDNPVRMIVGYGSGSTRSVANMYLGAARSTHNSFISVLVTSGIIGLIIMLAMICKTWSHGARRNNKMFVAMLIVCIVSCMTIDFFHQKEIWNVFTLIWAIDTNNIFSKENTKL